MAEKRVVVEAKIGGDKKGIIDILCPQTRCRSNPEKGGTQQIGKGQFSFQ